MSDHLSPLSVRRLSVDDLGADDKARATAHLEACTECRAALEAVRAGASAFAEKRTPEHFMMQLAARRARERRKRAALVGSIGSALAVAAVLVLFVRPSGDTMRMKGGGVNVLRKRDGVVTTLGPDGRIRAGDALELQLTRTEDGKLAAWAVDATGHVDALTEGVVAIAAGATLPSSAVVESPCRDLWIVIADRAPYVVADPAALVKLAAPAGVIVRPLRCE